MNHQNKIFKKVLASVEEKETRKDFFNHRTLPPEAKRAGQTK
ncbi:MAG: hypothetical protein Q7R88_00765 [bacterium]|nr:hypothetical protein [bacterium]